MKLLNLKTKLILATTIVFVLLLFVGCSKDDGPAIPTSNDAPFTFIELENEWIYGIYTNGEEPVGTARCAIVEPEDLPIFIIYTREMEIKYDNADSWTTTQIGLPTKDYWVVNFDDIPSPMITLHYNCYVGKEWSVGKEESAIARIVSVSERVTVPAGTFNNCIKVEVQYVEDERKNYYWIHKNYGNIMAEEDGITYKLHSKSFD